MYLEYNYHTHSLKMKTPLYDIIRAAKPDVASSTINTYVSLLTSTFYSTTHEMFHSILIGTETKIESLKSPTITSLPPVGH